MINQDSKSQKVCQTDQKIQQKKLHEQIKNQSQLKSLQSTKYTKRNWQFSKESKHDFIGNRQPIYIRCKTDQNQNKLVIIQPKFTSELLSQLIEFRIVKMYCGYNGGVAFGICNVEFVKQKSYKFDQNNKNKKGFYLFTTQNMKQMENLQKQVCLNMKEFDKIKLYIFSSASQRYLQIINGEYLQKMQINQKADLRDYAFCVMLKGFGTSVAICQ